MIFQRAFAKINLGLRILGRRPDGYHDIETVFHRIDIFDEIFATDSPSIDVECSDPSLAGEANLCFTAARLTAEKFKVDRGVRLTIRKNIPVGAGLGGGSTDAATALRLLNVFWGLDLPAGVLRDIALRLGSDVPFFLGDESAYATSRGEVLSYFPLSLPYAVVVVFPGVPVSTAAAYGAVRLRKHTDAGNLRTVLEDNLREPGRLRELLTNDFEEYVYRTYPEIASVRDGLASLGAAVSLLSGSGSSVFGLFPDPDTARTAQRRFSERYAAFFTPPGFRPSLEIGNKTD